MAKGINTEAVGGKYLLLLDEEETELVMRSIFTLHNQSENGSDTQWKLYKLWETMFYMTKDKEDER